MAFGESHLLIERKVLTVAATSVTFSGLNGNADRRYMLYYFLNNSLGVDVLYTVDFNGGALTFATSNFFTWDTASSAAATTAGAISTVNATGTSAGEFDFYAVTGVGTARRGKSFSCREDPTGAVANGILQAHRMSDVATNVTSLRILADTANGIGIGSEFALFRV